MKKLLLIFLIPFVIKAQLLTLFSDNTNYGIDTSGASRVFFVDALAGNDANDGLSGLTAWKTWYNFNGNRSNLQVGDTILFRRGQTWSRANYLSTYPTETTFNGTWLVQDDGIYYGAYGSGNDPIIDVATDQGMVFGAYVGYGASTDNVKFENIKFTNSVARGDVSDGHLIFIHYLNATHTTFNDCEFDASNESGTSNKNETFVCGADSLVVTNSYFHGTYPYNRHGLYTGGSYAVFQDNILEGFGLTGIKLNGDNLKHAIVSRNLIIDCLIPIEIAESDSSDIFSNIIIQRSTNQFTTAWGFQLEDDEGGDSEYPVNNVIANNTIIVNGSDFRSRIISMRKGGVTYSNWDSLQNNTIKNNIIYLYNNDGDDYFFHNDDGTINYPPLSDYNLYYTNTSPKWYYNSTDYTTLIDWQGVTNAPSGFEANSITTDPYFINHVANSTNPANYRLDSLLSGAVNTGVDITLNNGETFTDFYGGAVFASYDMGAIQSKLDEPDSLIYASDFSSDTDGFSGFNATASGNNDAILDSNDCLMIYSNATEATHFLYRTWYSNVKVGDTLVIVFDFLIENAQTHVDSWVFSNGIGAANLIEGNYFQYGDGGWKHNYIKFVATSTGSLWRINLTDNTAFTYIGANSSSDDRMFIKNVKIYLVKGVGDNYN